MEFQVRLTDEAIADLRGIVQLVAEKSLEPAQGLLTGFIVASSRLAAPFTEAP